MDTMFWIGDSTLSLDKAYTLSDVIKEVGRIKREDLRQVAREIFKLSNLNLALIGPLKDKEGDILKQLESGMKA